MKIHLLLAIVVALSVVSCTEKTTENTSPSTPPPAAVVGTWQLQKGTLIEKGDTTVTDFTQKTSFIKIINDSHFAFLQHDLSKGKDSSAVFVAGGGRYTLKDSLYTEHLEYCNDRNWEGHDFSFVVSVKGDTLVQSGVEKIESEGVDRINIEQYIRARQ